MTTKYPRCRLSILELVVLATVSALICRAATIPGRVGSGIVRDTYGFPLAFLHVHPKFGNRFFCFPFVIDVIAWVATLILTLVVCRSIKKSPEKLVNILPGAVRLLGGLCTTSGFGILAFTAFSFFDGAVDMRYGNAITALLLVTLGWILIRFSFKNQRTP